MKEVSLQFNNEKEKYCSICGEVLDIDTWGKSYCKTCRAEYNKTYYTEQVAGKRFVYSLWAGDRCLYVGSCVSIYRIAQHLRGGTHLLLTPDQWEALKVDKLIYSNVTDIALDEKERNYIEQLWINMYGPLLNKGKPDYDGIREEKMEILEDLVYNQYIDIEEIDIKKITLRGGKVISDLSYLILS